MNHGRVTGLWEGQLHCLTHPLLGVKGVCGLSPGVETCPLSSMPKVQESIEAAFFVFLLFSLSIGNRIVLIKHKSIVQLLEI